MSRANDVSGRGSIFLGGIGVGPRPLTPKPAHPAALDKPTDQAPPKRLTAEQCDAANGGLK